MKSIALSRASQPLNPEPTDTPPSRQRTLQLVEEMQVGIASGFTRSVICINANRLAVKRYLSWHYTHANEVRTSWMRTARNRLSAATAVLVALSAVLCVVSITPDRAGASASNPAHVEQTPMFQASGTGL